MIESLVCPNCGSAMRSQKTHGLADSQTATCKKCGMKFTLGQARELGRGSPSPAPPPPQPVQAAPVPVQQTVIVQQRAGKSRGIAILLALFLGGFGIHHFYLDRPWIGIACLLFFWTFIPTIAALVEIVVMLLTSESAWRAKYG